MPGTEQTVHARKPPVPNPRIEPDLSTYQGRLAQRLHELRKRRFRNVEEFVEELAKHKVKHKRYGQSKPRLQPVLVSARMAYHYEQGTRAWPVEYAPAYAKALGVKIRDLFPEK